MTIQNLLATISRETISKTTDEIVEHMIAWQNRPMDPNYPVLLIDAIEPHRTHIRLATHQTTSRHVRRGSNALGPL